MKNATSGMSYFEIEINRIIRNYDVKTFGEEWLAITKYYEPLINFMTNAAIFIFRRLSEKVLTFSGFFQ